MENAVGIPIATSVEALRDCRQVVIFLQKDEHRESGLDSPGHIGDRAIREPVCREGGAQPLYVSWLRSEGQPVCPPHRRDLTLRFFPARTDVISQVGEVLLDERLHLPGECEHRIREV